MTPHVRPLLVSRLVCHKFLTGGKLHSYAPIRALVISKCLSGVRQDVSFLSTPILISFGKQVRFTQ